MEGVNPEFAPICSNYYTKL